MCPLVEGWITKLWCIHSVENYSSLKREKKIERQVAIGMEESTVLSEISKVHRHTYCMALFACGTSDARLIETDYGALLFREMGASLECSLAISIKDVHKYVSPPTQQSHLLVT